jgi:hypothetical protein
MDFTGSFCLLGAKPGWRSTHKVTTYFDYCHYSEAMTHHGDMDCHGIFLLQFKDKMISNNSVARVVSISCLCIETILNRPGKTKSSLYWLA